MKIFHPETFQGSVNKKNYFEGWYYKTVSTPEIFAVIPGLSLGADSHAFIQLIDGRAHTTNYLRFPLSEFKCKSGTFDITLGKNRFLNDRIILDENRETISLHGELRFRGLNAYPVKIFSPGIMGPFRFVPFMECYHGVVSVDHEVNGEINWNSRKINISDGRGYIEKDWGRSMPGSWIWLQSNFFRETGTSFMLSVARIPWLGRSFNGHLGYFYHENKFYPFATYNGSSYQVIDSGNGRLTVYLRNNKYKLEAKIVANGEDGELIAPVNGEMQRPIREKTDAEVSIILKHSNGDLIYEGTGNYCGIEITGDMSDLF